METRLGQPVDEIAAFSMIVSGRSRRLLFLPALPLGLWLASLGQGCLSAWLQFGVEGLRLSPDWKCFPSIVLVGAVPAIAMLVMLHRGAPLLPHATVAFGGLAAAALGSFGLRLFHPQDASVMVLVWQLGSRPIRARRLGRAVCVPVATCRRVTVLEDSLPARQVSAGFRRD